MKKRVKLFDLGDDVQVVVVKKFDTDEDKPAIAVTFYDNIDGEANVEVKITMHFDTDEQRDDALEKLNIEKLQGIFNNLQTSYR